MRIMKAPEGWVIETVFGKASRTVFPSVQAAMDHLDTILGPTTTKTLLAQQEKGVTPVDQVVKEEKNHEDDMAEVLSRTIGVRRAKRAALVKEICRLEAEVKSLDRTIKIAAKALGRL